jgi:hypothetical protein
MPTQRIGHSRDDGQTRVFTFFDWDEQGPRVQPADVRAEEEAFRVAAA